MKCVLGAPRGTVPDQPVRKLRRRRSFADVLKDPAHMVRFQLIRACREKRLRRRLLHGAMVLVRACQAGGAPIAEALGQTRKNLAYLVLSQGPCRPFRILIPLPVQCLGGLEEDLWVLPDLLPLHEWRFLDRLVGRV